MRAAACACVLAAVLLAACGSSPEPRYYALSTLAPPSAQSGGGGAIEVGPVTVPDMVDRAQIVTRIGERQLQIAEQARWIAPLRYEIARVVADDLAAASGRPVAAWPQSAGLADPLRVSLDVQRFESASDAVLIEAVWTLRPPQGAARSGRSIITEPVQGTGYDALAAAHSRALAHLSRDLLAVIMQTENQHE